MTTGPGSGGLGSHGHPHTHAATATPSGSKSGPNPAVITIWITVATVIVILGLLISRGCSSLSNSSDTGVKPIRVASPRAAATQNVPSISPVFTVPEDARGFVRVPTGTKEVRIKLKKNVLSPWVLLPTNNLFEIEHKQYPILYQRSEDQTPFEVKKPDDPSARFKLSDGRIRMITHLEGEEVVIFLTAE